MVLMKTLMYVALEKKIIHMLFIMRTTAMALGIGNVLTGKVLYIHPKYVMVLFLIKMVYMIQTVQMDQMRILIFAVERPKELMIIMVFIMRRTTAISIGNVLIGMML